MKYFSVPICPYCKKRVNLIRTWSLKRQGEYLCPRCGGISNIYLSPLVYVFALMAVLGGGALYFFHKFVLDDVSLMTVVQVLIPFAVFFLLSLFMVYLEKPVIKTVSKAEVDRRRRAEERREARKKGTPVPPRERPQEPREEMFVPEEEYLPKVDYRTGPMPLEEPPAQPETAQAMDRTSVIPVTREPAKPVHHAMTLEQVTAPTKVAPPRPAAQQTTPAPVKERLAAKPVTEESGVFEVVTPAPAAEKKPVSSAAADDDFFAKYNDPEYVERRLAELNRQREEKN